MSSYQKQIEDVFDRYIAEQSAGEPATLKDVCVWAYREKLILPQEGDVIKILTKQMSDVLRAATHKDPQERTCRSKVAAPRTTYDEAGKEKQEWLWADMRTASHPHVVMAFVTRRTGIFNDVVKLRDDVDSYNDNHRPKGVRKIQMSFNFDNTEGHEEGAA